MLKRLSFAFKKYIFPSIDQFGTITINSDYVLHILSQFVSMQVNAEKQKPALHGVAYVLLLAQFKNLVQSPG